MKCDLVIKNGHVIDPSATRNGIGDIYVHNGLIVDGKDVSEAGTTYDATGKYVFPGLIDYHAHVFPHTTEIGIDADSNLLPQGVTTVVDPGSAGVATAKSFVENIVCRSEMNVYGFINVCPSGLSTMKYHEDVNPKYWDKEKLSYFFTTYPAIFKGLKVRISKGIVQELGIEPLYRAVELAEDLQVPLGVHVTDAPVSQAEVIKALRPGDIFIHCFHGTGNTILGDEEQVLPEIRKAQERGVLLDASNGGNHWSFKVADTSIKSGLVPDIISTDLTIKTLYKDPVFSLPFIMSKYLALGMSIEQIIACCTINPAKALGLGQKIGSLQNGCRADISVMSINEQEVTFTDTQKQSRRGSKVFVPQITICGGKTVYRNIQSL